MLMGTCHCGSAQWTLEGDAGVITACNCTLCRRYGALWACAPRSRARRRPMSAARRTFGHWRFSSVRNAAACSAGAAVVSVRTAAAAWRSMCVWHRPKQSLIFGSSISAVSTNSPGFLPMEAVSETSGADAPDTIRTCESLDGIFVDDGPLADSLWSGAKLQFSGRRFQPRRCHPATREDAPADVAGGRDDNGT